MAQTTIKTEQLADDAVTSAKLDTNITIAGTLGSTGKITADAGIDIDNFNIDGTTIALSSGDMLLDAAGDIVLDAAGEDIFFKANGTTFGQITTSSGDFHILQPTSDKDILFRGLDGSTYINALTLDMSDAGAATFNSTVTVGSNMGNFIPVTSGTTGASLNANGNGLLQLQSGGVTKATINDSGGLTLKGAGNAGHYSWATQVGFAASATKNLVLHLNGSNVFGQFRVRMTGDYGNVNAIGSFEKVWSIGVNSSNTSNYAAAGAGTTVFDSGSTSGVLTFGSMSKPSNTTVQIPITNGNGSHTVQCYVYVEITGDIAGISHLTLS
jgi:hypothetical protein|tara:strand:+ start:71 stop:1048 length:978 start_codon:yes stop_codon:yes gene_type:complete